MYIHTPESAIETIKNYQELQGFETLEETVKDMDFCYDDLDSEDQSALDYFIRYSK